MLKKIFDTKRVKATAGWRHLHHEKVHYLHSLSDIIQVIKSMKLRWGKHEISAIYKGFWLENLKERITWKS